MDVLTYSHLYRLMRFRQDTLQNHEIPMNKHRVSIGIAFSDRVIPFLDGSVRPSSFELEFELGAADDIF